MKLYIGQPIDIELVCTVDGNPAANVTSAVIQYCKPSGATGSWTATFLEGTASYAAAGTAIDEAGGWRLQPVLTFTGGKVIPGETVGMPVFERFA